MMDKQVRVTLIVCLAAATASMGVRVHRLLDAKNCD